MTGILRCLLVDMTVTTGFIYFSNFFSCFWFTSVYVDGIYRPFQTKETDDGSQCIFVLKPFIHFILPTALAAIWCSQSMHLCDNFITVWHSTYVLRLVVHLDTDQFLKSVSSLWSWVERNFQWETFSAMRACYQERQLIWLYLKQSVSNTGRYFLFYQVLCWSR